MPSLYLKSDDYAAFGLPTTTTDAQVTQSSSMIDAYLNRPEGLIWAPDANGNPAYMLAKTPEYTALSTAPIVPGKNVTITLTGTTVPIQVGYVAILDRNNGSAVEACTVISVNGTNNTVIQLANVQFNHDENCTLDFGMAIFDSLNMPKGRTVKTLSRYPIVSLLSGQGRYGYGRRGNTDAMTINEFNLLATVTQFGGPPLWEIFDVSKAGFNPDTAQVWVPAGVLLAYYTEVRLTYIAGWTYAGLPTDIKMACAILIKSLSNTPINGNIKNLRAGDTAMTFFAASNLSDDTKSLLEPYKARLFA